MMAEDWKDALFRLKGVVPEGDETTPETTDDKPAEKREKLAIAVEKKGRGGKTATIIYGFLSDDDTLAGIAASLKQKLGIGGSARGGEILLQGDCRQKAAELLRKMGFKVR